MAEDEPRQDSERPPDARFESLDERLRNAQQAEAARTGKGKPADSSEQAGNKALSYLIGGLFGGAVVGWALDQIRHTTPLFLLLLMFLGTAAGFRSIIRMSSKRPD